MDLPGKRPKDCRKSCLEDVEKLKRNSTTIPKEPASFGGVKDSQMQATKTIAYGVNELWQSDLVDLQKISRFNRGYRYLLTIIDVMSRYLRAFPIKDKKTGTIAKVFHKVFKEVRPKNIQTDKVTREIEVPDETLLSPLDISLYNEDHEDFVAGFNANMKNIFTDPPLVFTLTNNKRQLKMELKRGFDWIITPEEGNQLLRVLGLDPNKNLKIRHKPEGFTAV
ncbi:uncharacterized protein TNCV_792201 [Trichonephila clavipes]|nr:uncharacterized protein TNCV_792201 [Trichonephila clavipes]